MPKVSVIIPVYGVEKYIKRCAKSLFEQTLDDIEYIFVDDCSPDKSIAILENIIKEYQPRLNKEHKNVRIEKMSQNSGLPNVRRYGIKLATSDYIAHCDSDDWVELDMYQQMYNKAIEEDADVVVCDYVITNGTSVIKTINACHAKSPGQLIEKCLFQRDPWSLCNKLFKRKAYYNIEYPKGAMGEDMVTTIQLLWNCKTLSYINKPYYQYFYNSESITKICTRDSCISKFNQLSCNTTIVMNFIKNKKLDDEYKDALVVYKNFIRSVLYPIVYDKQYYNIWNNMFLGLNKQVLLSKYISASEKIRVFLTMVHLYPRKRNRAY